MNAKDAGKVITVRGAIDPDQLGITLSHEHLFTQILSWSMRPPGDQFAVRWLEPVTTDNAPWLRQFPYYQRENLVMTDRQLAETEIRRFKLAGGSTVVDAGSRGCGRDVWGLRRLAEDVGLNIVAGSGYYVDASHPWDMDSKTVDVITEEIIQDVLHGADGTDIRCGLIGEIGTSDPVTQQEWKVVRAAAQAHHETGAPIQIHCLHWLRLAPQIVEALVEDGVHPSRIAICHMDSIVEDWDYTKRVADYGVFIEYDGFGCIEVLYVTRRVSQDGVIIDYDGFGAIEGRYISTEQRLAGVERLVEEGYGDRLLLAQDIGLPARMGSLGGEGWDYILTVIVPELRRRGMSSGILTQLLVTNPKRFFTLGQEIRSETPLPEDTGSREAISSHGG